MSPTAQTFRVGGAPTARSNSHPFFGHSLPHAGTTLHNVVLIPDKLLAKSIHVSSTSNPIAGNAVLEASTGLHKKTIHTSFTWTSQCHWTFLVIVGIKYPTAKLSVSTLTPSARLEGTMETNSGTLTVDTYLTTNSGGCQQYLHIPGADLKLETKSAKITEFDVEKTFTAPTSGCAEFSATRDGKFRLKGKNYTLHKLHIELSCGTLKAFKFHLTISHTDSIGVTKSGTLAVALLNEPGATDELKGPGVQNDAIHYKQCLWVRRTDQEEELRADLRRPRIRPFHQDRTRHGDGDLHRQRRQHPRNDRRGRVLQCGPRLRIIRMCLPPLDVLMHREDSREPTLGRDSPLGIRDVHLAESAVVLPVGDVTVHIQRLHRPKRAE